MGRQILVRQKMLHGDHNRLLHCEVLSESDGKIRCKCEGEFKPREVQASEVIPAEAVFGRPVAGRRSVAVIQKQHPSSPFALANIKRK